MKRRLPTIIVFILLGAIVNIAVAWACALLIEPFNVTRVRIESSDKTTYEWRQFGVTRRLSTSPERVSAISTFNGTAVTILEKQRMDRGGAWRTDHVAGAASDAVVEERAGWPMRSLMATDVGTAQGGIRSRDSRLKSRRLQLPNRPIWPAFAINTIFYGLALSLLWMTPFGMRRRLRIRRGLCAKCAYPIGKSPVCTECGSALPSRPSATS